MYIELTHFKFRRKPNASIAEQVFVQIVGSSGREGDISVLAINKIYVIKI